jgi:amino acid adenylation domain-containing protein
VSVSEILAELGRLGVNIKSEKGELIVSAPKGVLTSGLRDRIREHRSRLLSLIDGRDAGRPGAVAPIRPAAPAEDYPLSFGQERLWFVSSLKAERDDCAEAAGTSLFLIQIPVRLRGPLDPCALKAAVRGVARRHDVLRTRFQEVDERPRQRVNREAEIAVKEVDLGGVPAAQRDALVLERIAADSEHAFDLGHGIPCRAELMRLEDDDHVLLFSVHHIAFDGWSVGVLFREIDALYRAFLTGGAPELPALAVQYSDYAVCQREHLGDGLFEPQMDYWRTRLQGMETLQLPLSRSRSAVQGFSGARCESDLPGELLQGLRRLGARQGATLFTTLLAGFVALLHRYSGQEDVVVGTAASTRNCQELEHLIGFFVNMLVLRTDVSGKPTFTELLRRVHETVVMAYEHQDLPFEKVVDELEPHRDLGRNPLFQASFTLQSESLTSLRVGELNLEIIPAKAGATRVDLECQAVERADRLTLRLVYNVELFDRPLIERMLCHYENVLKGMLSDPDSALGSVQLLSANEKDRLLALSCGEVRELPSRQGMIDLFRARVGEQPDRTAAEFGGTDLSYRQLDAASNQVAHFIRAHGVQPGSRVGLCVKRGFGLVTGLLGIWKARAAYLPLDPEYPDARLRFMLEDAGVRHVVTQHGLVDRLRSLDVAAALLEIDGADVRACDTRDLPETPGDHDLAYVIYTSGSTGVPKGVLIAHGGLCNLSAEQVRAFGVGPGDRVLQFSSPSFDAATFDVVMALGSGATLVMARKEALQPGEPLASLLRDAAITILTIPPSALSIVSPDEMPLLRVINVAGEACAEQLVARWLRPGRRFFNLYGPTEATIWSTTAECRADGVPPAIGWPIGNVRTYVLDAYRQLLPKGVSGELYIGGVGVAKGYLGRPDLSESKFLPDTLHPAPGARMYRTGDLVRWREDDGLAFIGRVDGQVKVRGFRIELGEIEQALARHPGIREAAAAVREDRPGDRRICAYFVREPAQEVNFSGLRSHLRSSLPAHMLPTQFVELSSLPLTRNGKLNRDALPEPEVNRQIDQDYAAPGTPAEQRLAAIWCEVLGIEKVGVHDNFFELGGNSLLVMQVRGLIEKEFGIGLAIVDMFDNPTVHALARHCTARRGGADNAESSTLAKAQERARKRRTLIHRRGQDAQKEPAR